MKIEIEVTARRLQDEPAVIRRLIIHFGLVLALGTAATDEVAAQQVSRVPRIGLLLQTSPGQTRAADEFREDMRSLGWSDGSTVSIEDRFANGDPTRLSANAAEFVASKVDVIVAFGPLPTLAARHASSTIPIVGATIDPGLVQSLSRPGGNVTGVTLMMPDITAKQLQLLKEVVPQTRKVGILSQNNNPLQTQLMTEIERGAATLGISVLPVRVGTAQDLPPCLTR